MPVPIPLFPATGLGRLGPAAVVEIGSLRAGPPARDAVTPRVGGATAGRVLVVVAVELADELPLAVRRPEVASAEPDLDDALMAALLGGVDPVDPVDDLVAGRRPVGAAAADPDAFLAVEAVGFVSVDLPRALGPDAVRLAVGITGEDGVLRFSPATVIARPSGAGRPTTDGGRRLGADFVGVAKRGRRDVGGCICQ